MKRLAWIIGTLVLSDMSDNVWTLLVEPGQKIKAGEPLVILEAMKMEFNVLAPHAGMVGTPAR